VPESGDKRVKPRRNAIAHNGNGSVHASASAEESHAGVNGAPPPPVDESAGRWTSAQDIVTASLDPSSIDPDLSASLLHRICHSFDLGDYLGFLPAARSAEGLRLLLSTSTGDYGLRSVGKRDYSALGLHVYLDLLAYLRKRQYPAPRTLTTRSGAAFISTANRFFYVSILPTLGSAYQSGEGHHLTAAAEGLAALHNLMRDYPGPYRLGPRPHLRRLLPLTITGLDRQLAQKQTSALAATLPGGIDALAKARDELAQLTPTIRRLYGAEPLITTHGSFDQAALLFDPLGLAEVDNFERTGLDVRLMDLAYAIEAFCGSASQGLFQDDEHDFLDAYRGVAPLTELESNSLPVVLRARSLLRLVDTYREHMQKSAEQRPGSTRRARTARPAVSSGGVKPSHLSQEASGSDQEHSLFAARGGV
jgi:Ser/Thr protein kinase RdoA (MazF antagonist)